MATIALGTILEKDKLQLRVQDGDTLSNAEALPTFVILFGATSLAAGTSVQDANDTGVYYPNIAQPGTAAGTYSIVWTFIKNSTTYTATVYYVVFATLSISVGFDEIPLIAKDLIKRIRYQLRDFSPDKHYTLAPMLDVGIG